MIITARGKITDVIELKSTKKNFPFREIYLFTRDEKGRPDTGCVVDFNENNKWELDDEVEIRLRVTGKMKDGKPDVSLMVDR